MSTKASALNASTNNSPTNSTMNSSTTAATPTVVKIKKELPSDEIKEYAESTMNELLGWYGFDGVDRLDLSAKTSKLLQTASIISEQQQQQSQQHQAQQQQQQHQHQTHHLEKRRSRASRAASLLHMQQQQTEHLRSFNNNSNHNNNNSGNNNNNNNIISNNSSINRKSSIICNSNNYRGNDSTTSDHDTRSSRDDDSKSPNSAGRTQSSATNMADENLVDYQNCCWCRRPVPENAPEFLTTSDGPRYCSESCFTQSRRASFKKAKTCDWCKHVRHAVSYVDFQDGASQLQFCSDKCLNQYKMQIFCKETQAHLDMNPHLKEQGLDAAEKGANLITPDLWLRNCRSRSASPASTLSISPGPPIHTSMAPASTTITTSPPPRLAVACSVPHTSNTSHKPLISVAPVSKLMSKSPNNLTTGPSPKPIRKRRPVLRAADIAAARANEAKTNCSASSSGKQKSLIAALGENTRSNLNQNNTQTLTQFAASCVQDLHMNVPPLSPMMDSQSSQPTTPLSLPPTPNRVATTIPPAFFANTSNNPGPQPSPSMGITAQCFNPRSGFLPNPNANFLPRFMGNFPGLQPPMPQPSANFMLPDLSALNSLIGTPPAMTITIPYPVIIPLPIPIPVPLPVLDFYKAYLTPEERKKYEEQQQMKKEIPLPEGTEEPLDFTKTKATNQNEQIGDTTLACSINEPDLASSLSKNSKEEEATSTTVTTPSEDSQTTSKSLNCILTAGVNENERDTANITAKQKTDLVSGSLDINEDSNEVQSVNAGTETNPKLPKLKITRLQTKRTLIQTKESECSRPLRKRKRIIDCDFQKLSNTTNSKEANDVDDELTTEKEQLNKSHHVIANNNNKK